MSQTTTVPPRRLVVTGGCGFIGRHLVTALVGRGDDVRVLDAALPAPGTAVPGAEYLVADIRERAEVARGVPAGTDLVLHLAAVVGVDSYLERPLDVVDVNLLGTRHVLDVATHLGARVVVASTSEVFGRNPAVPWAEDDDRVLGSTAVDRWSYGTSKALAEHLTFAFVRSCGTRASIVRYFNVYGPGQRPAFVVSRAVHRALNGLSPVVYDGGRQTRCFTYVDDAVEATLAVAGSERAVGEAYNVGSRTETSVAEVTALVRELTGSPPATALDTSTGLGARYEDLVRRVPETGKVEQHVGWRARTPLREGLAATVAWARATPQWLAGEDSGARAA